MTLDASPDVTLIGLVKLINIILYIAQIKFLFLKIRKQYQEQVIYETNVKELSSTDSIHYESEIGPEIMHEFKIINNGPSQISLTELLVSWQKQIKIGFKHKDFLYLMEPPYLEGSIKCELDNFLINPLNITVIINLRYF